MKRARRVIRRGMGITLFALPLLFVMTAASVNAGEAIRLLSFQGEVEHLSSDQQGWKRIAATMELQPGDTLRTGVKSRAEVAFPGGVIRMYENTLLELPKEKLRLSDEATGGQRAFLTRGRSLFKIVKRSLENPFEVVTPSLIAGVKGTVFRVAEEKERRGVEVFEGRVRVSNLDRPEETVELGVQQMTHFLNGHLTEPEPVEEGDRGWDDWGAIRLQEVSLGSATDEQLTEQRIQDRMEDRLSDLLENSRDFQQEVQTGSVRLPALTDQKVAVETFVPVPSGGVTSTVSGTTGTLTGTINGVTSPLTDLTGTSLPPLLP